MSLLKRENGKYTVTIHISSNTYGCGTFEYDKAVKIHKIIHDEWYGIGKHGKNKENNLDHPLYTTWRGMIDRCHYVKDKEYHRYGARGIYVCNLWKISFREFIRDMGNKPTQEHTLDRINGEKGYYKGNCRWATPYEQAWNKKKLITNSSGTVGVTFYKGRFRASITVYRKKYNLGTFNTLEEAIEARKKAEREYRLL